MDLVNHILDTCEGVAAKNPQWKDCSGEKSYKISANEYVIGYGPGMKRVDSVTEEEISLLTESVAGAGQAWDIIDEEDGQCYVYVFTPKYAALAEYIGGLSVETVKRINKSIGQ